MNAIITFLKQLKFNSISELRYVNRVAMNWLTGFLILFYFVEGQILGKEGLIASGFALWLTLAVAARYRDSKKIGYIHYVGAVLFFIPSIYYAGFWCLPIPIGTAAYFYFEHKEIDRHFLVLEVLLFINTQLMILL